MAKKKQRIKALLRFIQYCLLITALILFIAPSIGGINIVQAQEPECPPGFDWHRMSGVGCVQANCREISNAKLSYTSACICHDGYKGCYEPVDTEGINCGAHCPVSRLIACVDPEALCPGEEPLPVEEIPAVIPEDIPEVIPEVEPDISPQEPPTDLPAASLDSVPETQTPTMADLYQDLENFLAGEGITAPTPGQIGVTGTALATLLAGWLLLNLLSGTPAETSLEVISAWSRGQPPQEYPVKPTAPPDQPPQPGHPEVGVEPTPPPAAEPVREQQPTRSTPAGESTEDYILRTTRDIKDVDDAIKQTRRDFEAFEERIPASIHNSYEWQNYVQPRLDEVKNLIKRSELDQGRTCLDRLEQIIEIRNNIRQDLNYLPSDSQEAIVWTERTLRVLGHFATDAYTHLIIDPAKNAGNAILSADDSKRWNQHMDELNQALGDMAQGISELPRRGTRLYTYANLQDQAADMMQGSSVDIRRDGQHILDLYGPRDVPVEYPDFWGRGTTKVSELWNSSLGRLFK